MTTLKIVTRDYVENNTYILLGYGVFSLLLFVLNYLFFQHSLDAPVDIVFTMGYVVFVPGLIVLVTLFRTDINTIHDAKDYISTLIVHTIIPIIIGAVCIIIYEPLRTSGGEYLYHLLMLYGLSIPLILLAIIVVFEYHDGLQRLPLKILFIVVFILLYLVLSTLFNTLEFQNIYTIINIIMLYIIPSLLIGLWYYRVITKH